MRICKICEKPLKGRRDKKFCSVGCKNEYHAQIHRDNVQATAQIDAILHRNRIILKEILGDNVKQKKVKSSSQTNKIKTNNMNPKRLRATRHETRNVKSNS